MKSYIVLKRIGLITSKKPRDLTGQIGFQSKSNSHWWELCNPTSGFSVWRQNVLCFSKVVFSGIFHSFLSALWQFFFGSFNVLIHSGCLVEFVRFTIVSDPLILHGIDDWILLIISRLPLQLSSLDLVITLVHLIGSTTSYFGGCAVIAYTLGSKIFHVIRA